MSYHLTPREWKFVAAALIILAGGILVSWWLRDASWMPGVGALVIIAGILFAFTDLPELLAKRADAFAKLKREFAFRSRVDEVEEEQHTVLSRRELDQLRAEFDRNTKHLFLSQAAGIKKRLHAVEVFIVCLGTFVNGFGQNLVERLWK